MSGYYEVGRGRFQEITDTAETQNKHREKRIRNPTCAPISSGLFLELFTSLGLKLRFKNLKFTPSPHPPRPPRAKADIFPRNKKQVCTV